MEEQWIDRVMADKNRLNYAISLQDTGQYVGNVYLTNIDWTEKSGYQETFIGEKSFWNQGIGTQARLLMHTIIARKYGIRKVYSKIREDNLASLKSAVKCGFVELCRKDGLVFFLKDLS